MGYRGMAFRGTGKGSVFGFLWLGLNQKLSIINPTLATWGRSLQAWLFGFLGRFVQGLATVHATFRLSGVSWLRSWN